MFLLLLCLFGKKGTWNERLYIKQSCIKSKRQIEPILIYSKNFYTKKRVIPSLISYAHKVLESLYLCTIWRPRQNPNRSDALLDAYFAQNTHFCSLKHGLWKKIITILMNKAYYAIFSLKKLFIKIIQI